MRNKGQTTIFFSLMISVLLLFTLTALEVGRVYMARVKTRAVFHSTCSALMADYNSELFERYHLLFMDPTYGAGSEAALEEKAIDYLESSLNGEEGQASGIYEFTITDLMLSDTEGILDKDMALVKKQIEDYEKAGGALESVKGLANSLKDKKTDLEKAEQETEHNGVEVPVESSNEPNENIEVEDPRETLKNMLKPGLLSITLPAGTSVSSEKLVFDNPPSKKYEEEREEERDNSFQNIKTLVSFLKNSAVSDDTGGLLSHAAFVDYVSNNFSNGINPMEDSVNKCEIEYILKGKDSDYDNLNAVAGEILWLRMPVNYAYILTDTEKVSEALTVAATICTATGTEAMIEIVKYLLLGCWSYAETISEMRTLFAGEKIPYVKTRENWVTDLKSLGGTAAGRSAEQGLSYENYLMILLAKKAGNALNKSYARMLDIIDINIKKGDPDFSLGSCVGRFKLQCEINTNPHFVKGRDPQIYKVYLEEEIAY